MSSGTAISRFTVALLGGALWIAWIATSQESSPEERAGLVEELRQATGLEGVFVSGEDFANGVAPEDFHERTGAGYKPSYNEDPDVPEQCWIETGYGTQNACKYCHTDYLAGIGHGNRLPIGEDQILYSFPTPGLNRIPWRNVIHPEEVTTRLDREGIEVPHSHDPRLPSYVRADNWTEAYLRARGTGDFSWNNPAERGKPMQLFPALDPRNLFPEKNPNPTDGGSHGFVDSEGFVRDRESRFTGWRAVNFFPYAIFTPLTGSVSGIYIRLPAEFTRQDGSFRLETYQRNLQLLEANIKNRPLGETHYAGDASRVPIERGFYPVGTEFAHPLHYVDLHADGDAGPSPNGVAGGEGLAYEFPGTRAKRVKEIRYMYKWKSVTLEDLADPEVRGEGGYELFLAGDRQGWLENKAGWILAGYIEDRGGRLRPQTAEEMVQCKGCHALSGNTIDSVWSFQRKLPGDDGWGEMSYGHYDEESPSRTRLHDYENLSAGMGELGYFYYTVVGGDLFGVLPSELKNELRRHAVDNDLAGKWQLKHPLDEIFDDDALKNMPRSSRQAVLLERQRIMRDYADAKAYLSPDTDFIKGDVLYPTEQTMLENIRSYYKIVLDQSFNSSKHSFGDQPDGIPFTYRSDGTVLDSERRAIPVGEVITGRPWGEDGVGITPTGIVRVNERGEPVDDEGNPVDVTRSPERAAGHVTRGGTFDMLYNPILSDRPVERE
jgi:hypothetical protein